MRAEVFCDSNILLYAASNAPEDAVKRAAARRVLALPGVGFPLVSKFHLGMPLSPKLCFVPPPPRRRSETKCRDM